MQNGFTADSNGVVDLSSMCKYFREHYGSQVVFVNTKVACGNTTRVNAKESETRGKKIECSYLWRLS